MEAQREVILKALEQVIDPELKRNVVELDMVRDVRIEGGDVTVGIALTVAGCPLRSSFEQQVAQALAPVEGVERVSLEFGVMTPEERSALTARLRGTVTERTKGIQLDRSLTEPRSFSVSACRSSALITSNPSVTSWTPSSVATSRRTWSSKLERSGQPATVSAIVTAT